MSERLFSFAAGDHGYWRIVRLEAVRGESLDQASRLEVLGGTQAPAAAARWVLRGFTSNERYTARRERDLLLANQPALGRPEATCAALIPIRKSAAWWERAQDERREILEERSRHIATGLRYLPAIARRLHHCRDLGEPFDFLTWFEYAPGDSPAFEELVVLLRRSEEWRYVDREIDIRLVADRHAAAQAAT